MIPVNQRIISGSRGDCFSACIASILELPYEDVPRFVTDAVDRGAEHEWHRDCTLWLRERGLGMLCLPIDSVRDWRALVGVHALASVPSQKFAGGWHSVVCTWKRAEAGGHEIGVVHDPNPTNAPYPAGTTPRFLEFIVPFNPKVARVE